MPYGPRGRRSPGIRFMAGSSLLSLHPTDDWRRDRQYRDAVEDRRKYGANSIVVVFSHENRELLLLVSVSSQKPDGRIQNSLP